MGWKFDIKSAVVGAAVVAVAAILLGAANSEPAVGRYRIATQANYAYVIDTTTGKVWAANSTTGANGNVVFEPKAEASK
jgi:hypothetical protein